MEKDVFDFVLTFISIIWEAFPFVVLGAVVAGVLVDQRSEACTDTTSGVAQGTVRALP